MLYFIACKLEGEVADYYAKLTRGLSRKFGIEDLSRRIPAHITLKPPFKADDLGPVRARLAELAESNPALPLVIDGFETFRQKTVYLNIRMTDELQDTGTRIAEALDSFGSGSSIPLPIKMHTSVARHLAPGVYQRIMHYLEELPRPHYESRFDNLTLFRLVTGKWKVDQSFPLHSTQ